MVYKYKERRNHVINILVDFQADSIEETVERAIHSLRIKERNFEETSSSNRLYT